MTMFSLSRAAPVTLKILTWRSPLGFVRRFTEREWLGNRIASDIVEHSGCDRWSDSLERSVTNRAAEGLLPVRLLSR
jgi:hypothetical protein